MSLIYIFSSLYQNIQIQTPRSPLRSVTVTAITSVEIHRSIHTTPDSIAAETMGTETTAHPPTTAERRGVIQWPRGSNGLYAICWVSVAIGATETTQ